MCTYTDYYSYLEEATDTGVHLILLTVFRMWSFLIFLDNLQAVWFHDTLNEWQEIQDLCCSSIHQSVYTPFPSLSIKLNNDSNNLSVKRNCLTCFSTHVWSICFLSVLCTLKATAPKIIFVIIVTKLVFKSMYAAHRNLRHQRKIRQMLLITFYSQMRLKIDSKEV